jgi:hypothetical protein
MEERSRNITAKQKHKQQSGGKVYKIIIKARFDTQQMAVQGGREGVASLHLECHIVIFHSYTFYSHAMQCQRLEKLQS